MSRWIDGFNDEGFPWCPEKLPCTPGDKKYCAVCKEAVRQMDFMEGAILAEKGRHSITFDKVAKLELQNDAMKVALIELGVARAAWIHHCHAPEILKALWKVMEGDRPCTHKASEYGPGVAGPGETWTAPGVGAAGYSYCTCCGARNPMDSILTTPLKRNDQTAEVRCPGCGATAMCGCK
jgi:hypothetical protein